jgi:hypothetical protein
MTTVYVSMRQLFLRAGFAQPIADRICQDIERLRAQYRDFQPSEYGSNPVRVQISGTVPVQISGVSRAIPVAFGFPSDYPANPPRFWISLPQGAFRPGGYLGADGLFSPVLFSRVPAQSGLASYVAVLVKYLGDYPPVDPVGEVSAVSAREAKAAVDSANRAIEAARLAEVEHSGARQIAELLGQIEAQFRAEIPRLEALARNGGVADVAVPPWLEERIRREAEEAASNAIIAELTEILIGGNDFQEGIAQKITELGAEHFDRYVWPRVE